MNFRSIVVAILFSALFVAALMPAAGVFALIAAIALFTAPATRPIAARPFALEGAVSSVFAFLTPAPSRGSPFSISAE